MQRASSRAFPQFSRLPAELRIQVWQETCPRPGIHAFDVCIPSTSDGSRISQAFQRQGGGIRDVAQFKKFKDTIFLDQIKPTSVNPRQCCHRQCEIKPGLYFDPSAYRLRSAVQLTCSEAFTSLQTPPRRVVPRRPVHDLESPAPIGVGFNSVYLPGNGKRFLYDNHRDLLFLRFGGPVQVHNSLLDEQGDSRAFASGLSHILLYPWSSEFAATVQNARRVAIDVTELCPVKDCSSDNTYQEIACLSSCLQNNLELLYALCHPMSGRCGKDRPDIIRLQRKGELVRRLGHGVGVDGRQPDVFYGNGVTYHEVVALEELGWREDSSIFRILQTFSDTIRAQQGDAGCFQGVRVLVCQYDA